MILAGTRRKRLTTLLLGNGYFWQFGNERRRRAADAMYGAHLGTYLMKYWEILRYILSASSSVGKYVISNLLNLRRLQVRTWCICLFSFLLRPLYYLIEPSNKRKLLACEPIDLTFAKNAMDANWSHFHCLNSRPPPLQRGMAELREVSVNDWVNEYWVLISDERGLNILKNGTSRKENHYTTNRNRYWESSLRDVLTICACREVFSTEKIISRFLFNNILLILHIDS